MATILQDTSPKGKRVFRVRIRRVGAPQINRTFASVEHARRFIELVDQARPQSLLDMAKRIVEASISTQAPADPQTHIAILERAYQAKKVMQQKDVPSKPQTPKTEYTLNDAIERYRSEVLPQLRENTIKSRAQQLTYWADTLGDNPLTAITSAMIRGQVSHLRQRPGRHGNSLSNLSINHYFDSLSSVYSAAIDWDWITENPVKKVKRLKEPRGRTRTLSDDECERLLTACKESSSRSLYSVVILLLSTGCRKNEILTLKWRHVNLEKGTLHLTHTKNGEERIVHVSGDALAILVDMHTRRKPDVELLFPSSQDSNKPVSIETPWRTVLKKIGLDGSFRLHDLRHSFASYLAEHGASLIEIGDMIGHKKLEQTLRYTHLTVGHKKRLSETVSDRISRNRTKGNDEATPGNVS